MSDTRTHTEFRFFLLPQWEEEGAYLRRRHQQGWRLVKVSGLGSYRFEACPPEDVIYQLDYNPLPMAQKLQYLQTFQDCGWEYLQDYAGFSYFRKPAAALQPGEEGIFGDEASRQAMVTRLFRQRLLKLGQHLRNDLIQQILGAAIILVKSGAVDARLLAQLVYRDLVHPLFPQ